MPRPRNAPIAEPERLPVFVYGTLRPGQKNHLPYLAGRTTAELTATVRGRLYFVDGQGYPYLKPGGGTVVGTLAFLAADRYAATLARLDRLENYDPADEGASLYVRRRTRALLADGKLVKAWVYYWNCPALQGRKIVSGDFLRR